MPGQTRRTFLAGAAAVPFSLWLEREVEARGNTPLVRYDARSPEGQAMLKTYAKAVSTMKSMSPGDPRSWVFQWYTHWVRGPQSPPGAVIQAKSAALAQIYPMGGANRDLADAMWDTCQAHGIGTFAGEDENFFLPWHRMYVYYLEKIVRSVSGEDSFTLPYWNYSSSDLMFRGVIPPEFTQPTDPVFGALYRQNRNPGVNAGQPIQGDDQDQLSLDALAQCTYEPQSPLAGFCQQLDFGLHGNIHVLVGGSQNMGSVPFAARDPIFYLHHCNLDRLWASWNAAGRKNLALSQTFVFANENGQRVEASIDDFQDIIKLGYRYDRLETVPACPVALENVARASLTSKQRATARATPVVLGARAVEVALEPVPEQEGQPATPVNEHVQALVQSRRLYLVVRDLRIKAQPGVLYNIYLDLPAGADPQEKQAHRAGSINFFHAGNHAAPAHGEKPPEHAAAAEKHSGMFVSFDITDLARKLRTSGALRGKPILTIAPAGQPDSEAEPVVGEISLVEA